ncbi:permease prefix domain 1-containing protein [Eubacteriales bacterium OttesenSCG-928-A19]|nr:permease prefix domain 1-containing protein [Eubacteriales bacterium OttesenSCG-928-A19]
MQIRMLREIDAMFEGAPQNRKTLEAKEEMLQNLMEKYEDLLAEGRSEEAAFNIAIGSVGDISDLVEELKQSPPPPKAASFPEPDMSGYADEPAQAVAVDPEYQKHHKAMVVSVAVMLYILSPVAVIFFGGKLGLILLFVMLAAGTGLLIYNGMTSSGKPASGPADMPASDAPHAEESELPRRKMSKDQRSFFGALSSALWLITVSLYFLISFSTGAWHITWIIFLIAAAANNMLKAFMDMNRK